MTDRISEQPLDDVRTAQKNAEMRERTGNVASADPLVAFLYILVMTDHVEKGAPDQLMYFTNGYLAKIAEDVRGRLGFAPYFTWADVDELHALAENATWNDDRPLLSLADRIAALLPPREP